MKNENKQRYNPNSIDYNYNNSVNISRSKYKSSHKGDLFGSAEKAVAGANDK